MVTRDLDYCETSLDVELILLRYLEAVLPTKTPMTHSMKKLSFIAALIATLFLLGGAAYSQDRAPQRVRSDDFGIVGYRGVVPKYAQKQNCCGPKRAYKLKTVEICRRGFTKMEKHCCGIVTKANFVRVVYKSYYSDGTEVICTKEYRS